MSPPDGLPGSGGGVPPGGAGGSVHCWAAEPLQGYTSSSTPALVLAKGSSRHVPDALFSSAPSDCGVHTWLAAPSHGSRSTSGVPVSGWVPPVVSRHKFQARTVPSDQVAQ